MKVMWKEPAAGRSYCKSYNPHFSLEFDGIFRDADKPASGAAAFRSAFNGLCIVFVQSTRQDGTIWIEASADGRHSTSIALQSQNVALRPWVP